VIAWNVANTLLHALASLAALVLARDLLGRERRGTAAFAALFFAVHFLHVEPVVWASGIATLLCACGVFAGLVSLRRAQRDGRVRDRVLSVVAVAAALMAQETAVVFVPLAFVTGRLWPVRPARAEAGGTSRLATVAPYAILFAGYALIAMSIDRGGAASPYRFEPGPHVLKNLAFFACGGFVPTRYWEIQLLWGAGGGLAPFLARFLARPDLAAPLLLAAVGVALALWRGDRHVRGGFAWIGAASLPFLFLPGSGERFHYLPSFGVCLAAAVGVVALERRLRARAGRFVGGLAVAAAFAVCLWGVADRQQDWNRAGRWTREFVARWGYFRALDPASPIEFAGVPDSFRSAWVFRNGFSSMVRLYWEGRSYWRQEERPDAAPPAYRMAASFGADGSLAIVPVRGEGRGAERPDLVDPPAAAGR
jgi:hypothetical protein